MPEYDIVVSEFELQSHCYIHFRINKLGKDMNLFIPLSNGLNSTLTVPLKGWVGHWITHEGWYAIKQRFQNIKLIDSSLILFLGLYSSNLFCNSNIKSVNISNIYHKIVTCAIVK